MGRILSQAKPDELRYTVDRGCHKHNERLYLPLFTFFLFYSFICLPVFIPSPFWTRQLLHALNFLWMFYIQSGMPTQPFPTAASCIRTTFRVQHLSLSKRIDVASDRGVFVVSPVSRFGYKEYASCICILMIL